jgi:dGTPase
VVAERLPYEARDWARFNDGPVKPGDERSQGEIDRSRIIHSAAFRRLQAKTQIFGTTQDSFFRTRLTHSLEVAQIAKGIALRVGADTDACEAIALAHDIGHPPFGHKGEEVLADLMRQFGGFEANAQNLRIVGKLETKSTAFRGLNLSKLVIDGLLKYRRPHPGDGRKFYYIDDPDVTRITEWAMEGSGQKTFECEVMDWADDIAYSVHDLEDGLHSGLITGNQVIRLWDEILTQAKRRQADCTEDDLSYALELVTSTEQAPDARTEAAILKELTSRLINEFIQVTRGERDHPQSDSTRHKYTVLIDPALRRRCEILKSLAYRLLIADHRVASLEARARHLLTSLFNFYAGLNNDGSEPQGEDRQKRDAEALTTFPEPFRTDFRMAADRQGQARIACDFIAGMTDEYAERVYARLFTGDRVAIGDY